LSLRIRALSALHRTIYSATGGRAGKRVAGMPVLMLTTVGKRTGKRRTVPLTYFEDGEAIVLVASYGGRAHNPAWFENLLAHPAVDVRIANDVQAMTARPATPDERARLWPRVIETYDGYRAYQAKTTREIPLAVLRQPTQRS
jgi:F420H(2)-dependent quinone reductase